MARRMSRTYSAGNWSARVEVIPNMSLLVDGGLALRELTPVPHAPPSPRQIQSAATYSAIARSA